MMELNEFQLRERIKGNDWMTIDDPHEQPIFKIENDMITELYIGGYDGDGIIAKKGIDELFKEFPNLKILSLDIEIQDSIPINIFAGLANLEELILLLSSMNNIEGPEVRKELFIPIKNINKLTIISGKIRMHDNALEHIQNLEYFTVHDKNFELSNINCLPERLSELVILNGKITEIDQNSFKKFLMLKKIVLELPYLTYISQSTFINLVNLEFIRIIGHHDTEIKISAEHFHGLKSLKVLEFYKKINLSNRQNLSNCIEIRLAS